MIDHDPLGSLSSWNDSIHFCEWYGVSCSKRHHGRVTALDLSSQGLQGLISSHIGNLSFLKVLSLYNNSFTGEIPPEIGRLHRLQQLMLSNNSLGGEIPSNIFGLLNKLRALDVSLNNLTGSIPPSFSNLSSLWMFSAGDNQLSGRILDALGHLKSLQYLALNFNHLYGEIPPSIFNLSALTELWLAENQLHGVLPSSIGVSLPNLENLCVYGNQFTGSVPSSLSNASNLVLLQLQGNNFTGSMPSEIQYLVNLEQLWAYNNDLSGTIPPVIGKLHSLERLHLYNNNISGYIPDSIGNLTRLFDLDISGNNLQGQVPGSIENCQKLTFLNMAFNNLNGEIPLSIFNISTLKDLHFSHNHLHGTIPWNIGISLPNLETFSLPENHFTGSIPLSLSNASNLVQLQLNINNFTGSMPSMVGNLKNLGTLDLSYNMLSGSGKANDLNFLTSLINATSLGFLSIGGNNFGGSLPQSIGNLSTSLKYLGFYNNKISGSIPNEVQYLVGLEVISASNNNLSGTIPSSIQNLHSLRKLYLGSNILSGYIPFYIGNLTKLIELYVNNNNLHGEIPTSIQNCTNLLWLNLSRNNLSGLIPSQVMSLRSLSIALDLSYNQFIGSIPMEVGTLKNLGILDLSNNMLSGSIPSSMGGCISLQSLYLQGNLLQGIIPSSFSSLKGIQLLDLSANNLSGQIPKFLELMNNSQLLNLSFNNFEGEVPRRGAFKNASIISVEGNSKICGGIAELKLPPCHDFTNSKKSKKALSRKWKIIVMSTISSLLFLIFIGSCLSICLIKKRGKQDNVTADDQLLLQLSYQRLYIATDGFSSVDLIGIGSFGSVYRGVLHADGTSTNIAVKVFNLQRRGASKSFMSECEALKNIRHKNLMRIVTVCSSVDRQGNEFKALVYEYLANGSLEDWLHNPIERLDVSTRLNISIDIASAIDYLHNHCGSPIVHCDLKPSNILLDDDMVAHVGDFGLARFISANFCVMTTSIIGIIFYMNAEYGMGNQVSVEGDVYSYGVLLLELFTGRRPIEETFKEGLDLHNMVKRALSNQQTMEVLDPILLNELLHHRPRTYRNHNGSNTEETRKSPEELVRSILEIGVACSSNNPENRINMSEVVSRLTGIRKFCPVERRIEVNIRT
ncbi:Probable LRR receptor-like serine/threonine-protein kinase At3g47570 [Linum perenne]